MRCHLAAVTPEEQKMHIGYWRVHDPERDVKKDQRHGLSYATKIHNLGSIAFDQATLLKVRAALLIVTSPTFPYWND